MSNSIAFTAPKQGQKLKALQEELSFRARVAQEAKTSFDRSRQDLAKAIDDLGAPADGRVVVMMYETSELGPPGVYWETFDLKWVPDPKPGRFAPRPYAEGVAWAKEMGARGVKVDVPPPPTTLPSG